MEIVISKRKDYMEAVVPGDAQEARVYWHCRNSGFGLRFKCGGHWYSQWLMWSCRGGRASYFRPMVALYRKLCREGIVNRGTLRRLAN